MTLERKKPCLSCQEVLPLTAFYWDKRWMPWKRRSRCIACMCAAQDANNFKRAVGRNVYKRQRRAQGHPKS